METERVKIVKVISDGQLAVNAPGFRVVIRFKKHADYV